MEEWHPTHRKERDEWGTRPDQEEYLASWSE